MRERYLLVRSIEVSKKISTVCKTSPWRKIYSVNASSSSNPWYPSMWIQVRWDSRHFGTVVGFGSHVLKGHGSSYKQQGTQWLKIIFVFIYRYIDAYIDRPKIDLINLENLTNLATLNDENLKRKTFLKHIDQKINVEAGKNEL